MNVNTKSAQKAFSLGSMMSSSLIQVDTLNLLIPHTEFIHSNISELPLMNKFIKLIIEVIKQSIIYNSDN